MTESIPPPPKPRRGQLRRLLAARFSLRQDKADDAYIDSSLRAGVELSGSTPWVLMFAILIASIGLNVNSTAVIIGAMLVSPLMGPIMGVGYGVAIYDFALFRQSFLNVAIAGVISLLTSALYFLVSPLAEAQSELLARTTPTIWDVLIAMFGGFSGIVGATRKEKTNVIPGVAIATALLPPLCTAGYGLAKGNWRFFFGATYLFTINCVFIVFATVVIVSLFKLPRHEFVDKATERRVRRALVAITLVVGLPSFYLAHTLVAKELFSSNARQFVRREFNMERTYVSGVEISPEENRIELTLIGDPVGTETLDTIRGHLEDSGLAGATLLVRQAGDNRVDITSLRAGIMSDLFKEGLQTSSLKDEEIARLRTDLTRLAAARSQSRDIARELQAQYPQFEEIMVGEGVIETQPEGPAPALPAGDPSASGQAPASGPGAAATPPADAPAKGAAPAASGVERIILIVSAKSATPLAPEERDRIEKWLKVRAKSEDVRLIVEVPPAPAQTPTPTRAR